MATITSASSGNATAGATWSGGVAPSSGDRAVIAAGHTVTVNSAVDWESFEVAGGSPSGCLVIASGGTLTITADSLLGGHFYNADDRLRVEGGGILQCDPGGGAVKIQTGTAAGHRAILRLAGTSSANRATVRRKPSTTGTFTISQASGVTTGTVVAWEWGHFQTLATVSASIYTAVSSASHTVKNTIFEDVDLVDLRYTLDATVAIEDNTWTYTDPDATHTFRLWCASTSDAAVGTSTLKRNKFSTTEVIISDMSGSPTPRTMRGLDSDQNIFEGKATLKAAVTHKRALFYVRPPQHGATTYTIGGTNHATGTWNIDGAYFVGAFEGSATGNCHFLGATTNAACRNVVFDYVGIYGTDNGDALDVLAGADQVAKLSHALILPSTPTDADPRVTSGNIWNLVSGTAMARLEIDHCTMFSSRALSGIGNAHAAYSGSSGRTAVRDSLFWGDTGLANSYKALVAFTDAVVTEDTMDPSEIVSCAMSEAATNSNTVGGVTTALKGFSGMYFSAAPTVLDLDASGGPDFVDPSRSFLRWCREVRGHNSGNITTDMEAGLADIRDDITLMELSLKPWVEAGYVPRNALLEAATDNVGTSKGWIGALEGSTASDLTVTVTPASVTLPRKGPRNFRATVTGAANQAVTWSIQSGGGTINEHGRFVAPDTEGTVVLRATSVEDNTRYGETTVTVSGVVELGATGSMDPPYPGWQTGWAGFDPADYITPNLGDIDLLPLGGSVLSSLVTPVRDLPAHPHSDAIMAYFREPGHVYGIGNRSFAVMSPGSGMGLNIVQSSVTPNVTLTYTGTHNPEEVNTTHSDPGPWPIPPTARVQGYGRPEAPTTESATGDRHLFVVDVDTWN